MRQVSRFCVELSSGRDVFRPSFLFAGDCRICALLALTCEEEWDYPCSGAQDRCKKVSDAYCDECSEEERKDCIAENKPCCWSCEHLMDCLELQGDGCGAEFVEDIYGCTWEEFVEAVKALWTPKGR